MKQSCFVAVALSLGLAACTAATTPGHHTDVLAFGELVEGSSPEFPRYTFPGVRLDTRGAPPRPTRSRAC